MIEFTDKSGSSDLVALIYDLPCPPNMGNYFGTADQISLKWAFKSFNTVSGPPHCRLKTGQIENMHHPTKFHMKHFQIKDQIHKYIPYVTSKENL